MYERDEPHGPPTVQFSGIRAEDVPLVGAPPDPLHATTQLVGGQWDIDAEFAQLFRQPDPLDLPGAGPLPGPLAGLMTGPPGGPSPGPAPGVTADYSMADPMAGAMAAPVPDALADALADHLMAGHAAPRPGPVRPAVHHRKRRPRRLRKLIRTLRLLRMPWKSLVSFLFASATAAIACVVSLLGAMVSYDPLRLLAYPTAHNLASSWPLLVYGPWLAGCLSVLRAAAHQRHVRTAWAVVTAFSAVAVLLCVAQAPHTPTAMATAGLPPVAALACFHLLYRQITLVHPRHAKLPRQRKH
jgi:hypothetical protein